MTIPPQQLDALKANAAAIAADNLSVPVHPNVTLNLVAIARAALAWGEACDTLSTASYPIGEFDAAVAAVHDAAVVLLAATRGAP